MTKHEKYLRSICEEASDMEIFNLDRIYRNGIHLMDSSISELSKGVEDITISSLKFYRENGLLQVLRDRNMYHLVLA